MISPEETISRLVTHAHQYKFIDVRAPIEVESASLLDFQNLPILNNSQRELVGKCFTESGQNSAIELGLKLVGPQKDKLIQSWIDAAQSKTIIYCCWRGGLRSQYALDWTTSMNHGALRVQGGYKAMRGLILQTLESPPPIVILAGWTGSGKTVLISKLPQVSIDLEGIAKHKGSSFGWSIAATQPSQAAFENQLGLGLMKKRDFHLLEDESRQIGKLQIPNAIKAKMENAPIIFVDESLSNRTDHVYREYVLQPLNDNVSSTDLFRHYQRALKRIERRLGGIRFKESESTMRKAFEQHCEALHKQWIRFLLENYYDPQYEHAFKRNNRKLLFKGEPGACFEYIQSQIRG